MGPLNQINSTARHDFDLPTSKQLSLSTLEQEESTHRRYRQDHLFKQPDLLNRKAGKITESYFQQIRHPHDLSIHEPTN